MLNAIVIVALLFLLCMTLLGFQVESRKSARLGQPRDKD